MKKVWLVIGLLLLGGCGKNTEEVKNLKIIATSVPHAEILEEAQKILKEDHNLELEIIVTEDYYFPNKAVAEGDSDLNYFQHIPFFEKQVTEFGYDLVNVGGVHIEPIGIYSQKYQDVLEIEKGASVIISNSVADHGRVLNVFQTAGLIKINPEVSILDATLADIIENPKNLVFKAEVNPELLATSYLNNEADLIAINSNFALAANLHPQKDSLIQEASADNPYVNILVTRSELVNSEEIKLLKEILASEKIAEFIASQYQGSVIPAN